MNKVALSILSLLSRGPLSGYDLKQQMNDRITPFLKVSNNQVYPQMAKLEQDGLIKLHDITREAHHPEKKNYEITAAGVSELQKIATSQLGDAVVQDGFQLKMYNSWLLSEDDFLAQITSERAKHQEKSRLLENRLNALSKQTASENSDDQKQKFASWALLKYGQTHEDMYVQWCDTLSETYQKQFGE